MSYCTHGCGNPSQCLTCVSDALASRLEIAIRDAADSVSRQAKPQPTSSLVVDSIPLPKEAITKTEFLFFTGNDAVRDHHGQLFTGAYGRWIRTQ